MQGLGEAWGPAGVTRAYLDIVKPHFIGTSVFAQRGVAQTILARHYHMGTQNGLMALLGGIDIAAHDAMGKLLGVSVADLIGGRQRERVPVYASGGYFTAADDQEAALARAVGAAARQRLSRPSRSRSAARPRRISGACAWRAGWWARASC